MNQTPSTKQSTASQKTVLFCQGCEYHAPTTGSWVIHEKASGEVYECPHCGETVTVRGRIG